MRSPGSPIGKVRRRWILENLELDAQEHQKETISYLELLASYINPEFMSRLFDGRKGREEEKAESIPSDVPSSTVRSMTIGGVTFLEVNDDFQTRMKALQSGEELEPKDQNTTIPELRARLKARGVNLPSIRGRLEEEGISLDSVALDEQDS